MFPGQRNNQITTVFDAATVTGLSELKQYTHTFETRPEEITIRRNTTSTAWEDLAEIVAKQNNIIPYKNGEEATKQKPENGTESVRGGYTMETKQTVTDA